MRGTLCEDILLIGLLLISIVSVTKQQEEEEPECPEGYVQRQVLPPFMDTIYTAFVRPNVKNLDNFTFNNGIAGANDFLSLRGRDSYFVERRDRAAFLVIGVCVQTREVRNVFFEFMKPNNRRQPLEDDKVFKRRKSQFTDGCSDIIPHNGIPVSRVRVRFRTTRGRISKNTQENDFFIKNLNITTCLPIVPEKFIYI